MPRLWKLLIQNPFRSTRFLQAFVAQSFLAILERGILPGWPHYQSLRLRLQRAYWSASSVYFPELIHRLPVTGCSSTRAGRVGSDWTGYVIPGTKELGSHDDSSSSLTRYVIIYAHGGGYARGEARMYLNYMERWESGAKDAGLDLTFLSVEYPLTNEAPHPAQQEAFLKAYQNVLAHGVSPRNIIFMGDSAGGGLCVLSSLAAKRHGLPQPAGAILISPWMDMTLESFQGGNALVTTDYIAGGNAAVPLFASAWIDGIPGNSPQVNPLQCSPSDFQGVCPLMIFMGGGEFAVQEGRSLAALCKTAGVRHHLEVEWGQLHLYALGSKWISPTVREKTDRMIFRWITECSAAK